MIEDSLISSDQICKKQRIQNLIIKNMQCPNYKYVHLSTFEILWNILNSFFENNMVDVKWQIVKTRS